MADAWQVTRRRVSWGVAVVIAATAAVGAGNLHRRPAVTVANAVAAARPTTPSTGRTLSTSNAPGVPAGEERSPGHYHELPDTAGYVIHLAAQGMSGGSASSVSSGPERLRFDLSVATDGTQGTIGARLRNVSGRTMRFANGCRVVAEVSLDAKPWRTFDLVDPSVRELAPGQEALLEMTFSFDGPGQYSAWGSTDIELTA